MSQLEAQILLDTFVAVKSQLEKVNEVLAEFEPIPEDRPRWQRYSELTRLRGQLARQLATLATKLRPQSGATHHGSRPPPWARGDEPLIR